MSTDEKIKEPCIKPNPIPPQPYFIPGYSGCFPKLPITVGTSYGRVTGEILKGNPQLAGRLSPLTPEALLPEKRQERMMEDLEKDKRLINSRRPQVDRKVLNNHMVPGYSGHVPYRSGVVGMNFTQGCVTSIAKFIREQDGSRRSEKGEGSRSI